MTLDWLFDIASIPFVGLLVALLFVCVLIASRRRLAKRIVCPVDRHPRNVVFVGRTLDADYWDCVVSCGGDTGNVLKGKEIRCSMACLEDPANAPACEGLAWWGTPRCARTGTFRRGMRSR